MNFNVERPKHRQVLAVEIGDGPRRERNTALIPIAGLRDQLVIDEVEIDIEGPTVIRNRRRRHPAVGDVQHDLPPMVLHRSQSQSSLADDLGPAVERGLSWRPLVQGQSRPGHLCFQHARYLALNLYDLSMLDSNSALKRRRIRENRVRGLIVLVDQLASQITSGV